VTPPAPSVLFASYHAYPDHASGAALATRDLLEHLAARGWACRAVCGPQFDRPGGPDPREVLREYRLPYHAERCAPARGGRYELYHFALGGVPVVLYRPESFGPDRPPTPAEGVPFLDVVGRACARYRPDVVLTYGGLPLAPLLIRRARRAGARVVFCLHNLEYRDPALLREADGLWVPSEFARAAYRERVGVGAEAVTWPWDRARALAGGAGGECVTFVNPIPAKGAAWFARIAAELARRRPEVPLLVVEGRGSAGWLGRLPVDLSGVRSLRAMRPTPRPRDFYALSRLVLVPSLCEETFGRVAAEALANGLPVLATRRGALPETLGGAGLLFDVPRKYADPAGMGEVPSAGEVSGWVGAVERLWDDAALRAEYRGRALARARAWEPDRLCEGAGAFLRRVAAGGR
jgi:glycosyltransferase involved in cell wall biosynthesis